MEQLIKEVQALRAQLGMKPLSNPKKLGKAKLDAMADELEGKIEEREEMEARDLKKLKGSEPSIEAITNRINEKLMVAQPTKTVKELACELLCVIEGKIEGRTVGLPYKDILERIKAERPEAATSLACLRWYAGKIRVLADGYQKYELPQIRPRHKAEAAPEQE